MVAMDTTYQAVRDVYVYYHMVRTIWYVHMYVLQSQYTVFVPVLQYSSTYSSTMVLDEYHTNWYCHTHVP